MDDAKDYEGVNAKILSRYDINEETLLLYHKGTDESHCELANRIKDLGKIWLRQYDTVEKVVQAIVQEQLLKSSTTISQGMGFVRENPQPV